MARLLKIVNEVSFFGKSIFYLKFIVYLPVVVGGFCLFGVPSLKAQPHQCPSTQSDQLLMKGKRKAVNSYIVFGQKHYAIYKPHTGLEFFNSTR